MNEEDIVLDVAPKVGNVKGIDDYIQKMREATKMAVGSGMSDALENIKSATDTLNQKLQKADSYKYENFEPAEAQYRRLKHYIEAQSQFIQEAELTPATASYIAPVLRRWRANLQRINPFLPEAQRMESAQQQEGINRALNMTRAAVRANDAISATDKFLQDTNYLTDIGETPEEQRANLRTMLNKIRKERTYMQTAGIATDEYMGGSLALEKTIQENIAALDRSTKSTESLTEWVNVYGKAVAAGAAGIGAGNYLSNTLKNYLGNRDTAYTEFRHDMANLVQTAGGGIGALIGYLLGNAVAPGVGGIVGATIAGGAGGLFGGAWNRFIAAQESSQEDAIDNIRWNALYGGRGNGWTYARFASKTGMASVSDVQNLTSATNTFMPATAFGAVSDDQWLALSMFPNYFAALVAGADEHTMIKAYQADAKVLGPGYSQFFSQNLPGMSEGLRAYAMSGAVDMVGNDLDRVTEMQNKINEIAPGFLQDYYARGVKDQTARDSAWNRTAKAHVSDKLKQLYKGDISSLDQETIDMANALFEKDSYEKPDIRDYLVPKYGDARDNGTENPLTKRDLNIIIDGEKKYVGPVYTADQELESYIEYSAGSLL